MTTQQEIANVTPETTVRAVPMVVVAIPCEDQFCADVLSTALEGGIGYWSGADNIVRHYDQNGHGDFRYVSADLYDAEEGELLGNVQYDTIRKGIERILRGEVKCNSSITGYVLRGVADNDAGQIDADAADAIVQAGLLGELRFG